MNFMKKRAESIISLGMINFTNCIPVNYSLYKWNHEKIIISEGYPTLINDLMRHNQLDVAPVSSVEYLNNPDKYTLIDNICISSDSNVASVILFSNYELNELEGKKIGIPYTSATSVALLKIILLKSGIDIANIKFIVHKYEISLKEALTARYDAILYIGDIALISNIKYGDIFKAFDLGLLWKNITGCPMVFGSWVARSDWEFHHEAILNG